MSLSKQDKDLKRDLQLIDYPPEDWRAGVNSLSSLYDVAIIGAGMAGLTAAAALFKEGIFHIKVFDQSVAGQEGPWSTYARMKTLRSTKEIVGPALNIPHLTFRAWFEAIFGRHAWKKLIKIPNRLWMDYLNWYRQAMKLPVEDQCTLLDLIPIQNGFKLIFQRTGKPLIIQARKVIWATGRAGFGGLYIPDFVKDLPPSVYAHTSDAIDFEALKGLCIGIIGVGSSSFDAAAVALETGAQSVDLIMRRDHLPKVNKFASITYQGFSQGYFKLSDEQRLKFMQMAWYDAGAPPPVEALQRVDGNPNLRLLPKTFISNMRYEGSKIRVETNKGEYVYDFLILGTGFRIDGYQQPELRRVIDEIALWKDRVPEEIMNAYPQMKSFPYLGPGFEFLSKYSHQASYLKNLYCFNYAATLSHGPLSSDIPGISIGATRLAQHIAADFFVEDSKEYFTRLQKFQEGFEPEDFSFYPKS